MIISLIAAMDQNNLIGRDGDLPWRLPDDLRWYYRNTKGKAIIMGRKTYASMGGKPMKRRRNIVMTRQPDLVLEGCAVVHSVAGALAAAAGEPELMVSGGAEIYELFLSIAQRLYITRVAGDFVGDTYFPAFDQCAWVATFHQHHPVDENHPYPFDFYIFERRSAN